jgi:DNA-binding transcriptional MerR regulator
VSEDTRQPRGNDRGYRGEGGWVTTRVAAKALGVKPRQVRNYIAEGELEYRTEGNGVNKTYFVSINSVNELREKRNSAGIKPRKDHEVSPGALEATATAEMLEGFAARLEARAMEIGELKARLELTSQTESTLREQLQRERERADRLEEQLEEAHRSWWRRFFGFR